MKKTNGFFKILYNLILKPAKASIEFERDLKELNKTLKNARTVNCRCTVIPIKEKPMNDIERLQQSITDAENSIKNAIKQIEEIKEQDKTPLQKKRDIYYKMCSPSLRPDYEVDFINALEKRIFELVTDSENK